MALSAATHHSAQQNAAPWGPKTGARAEEEVEEQATHGGLRAQKTPPPGERPGILAEPGRRGVTAAGGTPQGELLLSRWCSWLVVTLRTTLLSPFSSLLRLR